MLHHAYKCCVSGNSIGDINVSRYWKSCRYRQPNQWLYSWVSREIQALIQVYFICLSGSLRLVTSLMFVTYLICFLCHLLCRKTTSTLLCITLLESLIHGDGKVHSSCDTIFHVISGAYLSKEVELKCAMVSN